MSFLSSLLPKSYRETKPGYFRVPMLCSKAQALLHSPMNKDKDTQSNGTRSEGRCSNPGLNNSLLLIGRYEKKKSLGRKTINCWSNLLLTHFQTLKNHGLDSQCLARPRYHCSCETVTQGHRYSNRCLNQTKNLSEGSKATVIAVNQNSNHYSNLCVIWVIYAESWVSLSIT
jgi:hypothetical protein